MTDFELFSQLHYQSTPLLLGNSWDVASAKLLAAKGFKAIATSSAAVAITYGYEDGQHMPFDLLLETAVRIKKNINLPLSVDMERGYADTIPDILQNIERLVEAGIVGINIEDSVEERKLKSMESFQKTIDAIANHLEKKNMQLFINARTDPYVVKLPNALEESLKRIKAYEAAGASGIFVPFVTDINDIKLITVATSLPVNVVSFKNLPSFKALTEAGVKRISLGSSLFRAMQRDLEKRVDSLLNERSVDSLF